MCFGEKYYWVVMRHKLWWKNLTSKDLTLSLRSYSYAIRHGSEKILRCKMCDEEIRVGDMIHSNKYSVRSVKYYHAACWKKLQQ